MIIKSMTGISGLSVAYKLNKGEKADTMYSRGIQGRNTEHYYLFQQLPGTGRS